MVLRRDAPSWLYQVDRGATTVWERWDAILPDGSIHGGDMDAGRRAVGESGSMLSFNHYAYGAMIDWVYRTVAGLAPDADDPGYRTGPRRAASGRGLDRAAAAIDDAASAELAIDWHIDRRRVRGDPRRAVRRARPARPARHRRHPSSRSTAAPAPSELAPRHAPDHA